MVMSGRRPANSPVGVLIFGLPRMLRAVLAKALGGSSDIELLSPSDDSSSLLAAARRSRPDVIVTAPDELDKPTELAGSIFEHNPYVRIICIAKDGRGSWRRELCVDTVFLGDISPNDLAPMVRDCARMPFAVCKETMVSA
jgi:hypothetical protein